MHDFIFFSYGIITISYQYTDRYRQRIMGGFNGFISIYRSVLPVVIFYTVYQILYIFIYHTPLLRLTGVIRSALVELSPSWSLSLSLRHWPVFHAAWPSKLVIVMHDHNKEAIISAHAKWYQQLLWYIGIMSMWEAFIILLCSNRWFKSYEITYDLT